MKVNVLKRDRKYQIVLAGTTEIVATTYHSSVAESVAKLLRKGSITLEDAARKVKADSDQLDLKIKFGEYVDCYLSQKAGMYFIREFGVDLPVCQTTNKILATQIVKNLRRGNITIDEAIALTI